MPRVASPPTAAEGSSVDEPEVPRYILEILRQLRRLAARAGDADLARDLAHVQERAESRKAGRLH